MLNILHPAHSLCRTQDRRPAVGEDAEKARADHRGRGHARLSRTPTRAIAAARIGLDGYAARRL